MKTQTELTNKITVKVEENQIQFNEKKVKLVAKNENLIQGNIEFSGFTFGGIKVAILNSLSYTNDTIGQQLITQASMLAWELDYELFISTQKNGLLSQCGFQSIRTDTQEIYCTELCWNAFGKVNVLSLTNLIQQKN